MLSTADAAAILGVDPSQVRRLILTGEIKATRLGLRSWVIDERDLDAYRQSPPKSNKGRPRKGTTAGTP